MPDSAEVLMGQYSGDAGKGPGRAMDEEDRLTFWGIGRLFVAGSAFWRLHVERGQAYVVFAFLHACVFALSSRAKPASMAAAGLVLGLLVAMRPSFAVALIPLVLALRWRLVLASLAGLAASTAMPAILFGRSMWLDYAKAMGAQGQQYLRWFGGLPASASYSAHPRQIDGIASGRWHPFPPWIRPLPTWLSGLISIPLLSSSALASYL